jgi:formate dehydrogenase subunit delta
MHSTTSTLVRMANDIEKFFKVQGDERAIAGISEHIRKFWEPRMKKQIFAHLDEGGEGLDPLTLKALQKLKADMHGKSTMAEAKAAAEGNRSGQVKQVEQVSPQPKAKAGNSNGGKAAVKR